MTQQYTRYSLKLAYLVSVVVAFLMTVASVAAILDWRRVYPGAAPDLVPLFVGQDALNLLVALPLLLGSMWLARRGSLIGLLLWPGALFYVFYDYGFYVLGAPFTFFFIPYIALMTLSAYAMIGVVVAIDADAVRSRLTGLVPARLVGRVLTGLAVLFAILWSGMSISAAAGGAELPMVPRVVTILDLTVQLPALFMGGILLMRGIALGYVVAAGLLLQAAAYLAGLSAITVMHEAVTNTPFDPVAVIPGIVVGIIGLGLISPFVTAASRRETTRPTAGHDGKRWIAA